MTKKPTKNTRQKILQTTGKLFSQRGYFGVSMQDIASEMGITKAALYYHFTGKDVLAEELMRYAVDELKKELKQAIENSKLPSDVLFNLIKTFLDFRIKRPEISLLVSLGMSRDEKIPILQFIIDLRNELTTFLRELIGGVDFIRQASYKSAFIISGSIISFVLSPFSYQKKNNKQLASDFSQLLFPKFTITNKKEQLA